MKFFTTIVWYKGLKESSTKVMERDEAPIISCRACLFFIVFWWPKNNIAFKSLFTFNPWLLSSFDFPSYCSELRKRYTVRLFLMCLEERGFGGCSAWGNGGQMTHFGERCAWGELGVGGKYANSLWNELHQRQFLKSSPTLHVHFPIAVFWALHIELQYKRCVFLNMSAKLVLNN